MIQYICLMRGINVGGKNMVTMKSLKDLFEEMGFLRVRTYINSGNILFFTEHRKTSELATLCKEAIRHAFNLDIDLMVLTADELADAMVHAPDWWDKDANAKHNAIFVIPPATSEEIVSGIGEIKPQYEKVTWHGPIIFWSAPLATFSRTRWSQIVKTKYYGSITIRNANTAKKLVVLTKNE